MSRQKWTPESIIAYDALREDRRRIHGFTPWHTLSPLAKEEARDLEKARVLNDEVSGLTTRAWEVGKHPIKVVFSAPRDGFLILPGAISEGRHTRVCDFPAQCSSRSPRLPSSPSTPAKTSTCVYTSLTCSAVIQRRNWAGTT
jgi:hypothetical protein